MWPAAGWKLSTCHGGRWGGLQSGWVNSFSTPNPMKGGTLDRVYAAFTADCWGSWKCTETASTVSASIQRWRYLFCSYWLDVTGPSVYDIWISLRWLAVFQQIQNSHVRVDSSPNQIWYWCYAINNVLIGGWLDYLYSQLIVNFLDSVLKFPLTSFPEQSSLVPVFADLLQWTASVPPYW